MTNAFYRESCLHIQSFFCQCLFNCASIQCTAKFTVHNCCFILLSLQVITISVHQTLLNLDIKAAIVKAKSCPSLSKQDHKMSSLQSIIPYYFNKTQQPISNINCNNGRNSNFVDNIYKWRHQQTTYQSCFIIRNRSRQEIRSSFASRVPGLPPVTWRREMSILGTPDKTKSDMFATVTRDSCAARADGSNLQWVLLQKSHVSRSPLKFHRINHYFLLLFSTLPSSATSHPLLFRMSLVRGNFQNLKKVEMLNLRNLTHQKRTLFCSISQSIFAFLSHIILLYYFFYLFPILSTKYQEICSVSVMTDRCI